MNEKKSTLNLPPGVVNDDRSVNTETDGECGTSDGVFDSKSTESIVTLGVNNLLFQAFLLLSKLRDSFNDIDSKLSSVPLFER